MPRRKAAPSYLVYYDGGVDSVLALRQACETAGRATKVVAVYLDVCTGTPKHSTLPTLAGKSEQPQLSPGPWQMRRCGKCPLKRASVPCRVKGPALVGLASEHTNATLFIGVHQLDLGGHPNPFVDFWT